MSALTVLVIEDDPAVARALRREFKVRSVNCAIASSAKELKTMTGTYPVAIVDVNLPDGNGIDLYDELLANERVSEGIFFTATDSEEDRARASACGTLIPKSQGVAAAVTQAMRYLEAYRGEVSSPGLPRRS